MATTIQASIIANGYRLSGAPAPYQFILDTFTNSVVAYSLRKLSSTYNGPAIRVRRSSDNAEQDIGFNLVNELDVTALLDFVGSSAIDNGCVTTWYDQSGNGRDIVQPIPSSQPLICTNGFVQTVGSKPSLYFFGSLEGIGIG